jgi:uncharacterized membrane protein
LTSNVRERPGSPNGRGVSARRRVAISAFVGAAAAAAGAPFLPWELTVLIAWDVSALTFTCWVLLVVWPLDAEQTARHAVREDPNRAAADFLTLSAAVASLVAVGYLLVRTGSGGNLAVGMKIGFAVLSVVASWAVIHTVFMLRYARLYHEGEDGGVDFHQDGKPRYSDFGYLAFTIGMTFQVSDTELNAPEIRATVLRHSLLSYLFGTTIVALTINLLVGLSR